MDDPNKPQNPTPTQPSAPEPVPTPVEPTPTVPETPAAPPADPPAQSTLPPITHPHTFGGGKAVFAGASALILILVVVTVVLVSQQSAKQNPATSTSAKTNYTPTVQPIATPTIDPASPDGVNAIDVGTPDEGMSDLQRDLNAL